MDFRVTQIWGEFLNWLRNCQLLKKTALWGWLVSQSLNSILCSHRPVDKLQGMFHIRFYPVPSYSLMCLFIVEGKFTNTPRSLSFRFCVTIKSSHGNSLLLWFQQSWFQLCFTQEFSLSGQTFPSIQRFRKVMGFYLLFQFKYQFPPKSVSFISHNDNSQYGSMLARVLNSSLINVRIFYAALLKFEQYSLDYAQYVHNFVSIRHFEPSNLHLEIVNSTLLQKFSTHK